MHKVNKVTPAGKHILKDVTLGFYHGAKIGILGANGAGKSTVMRIIAGLDESFTGDVTWSPGISVGYLSQEPQLDESKTVREIVEEGTAEIVNVLKEYEEINAKFMDEEILNSPEKMEALINRQAEVQDRIDALNAWELDTKLNIAMDALRCPPDDAKIEMLSGGERRRVALCRLLLQQPDVLLLDEPTNHLDAESIDWLEQHLEQYPGTVFVCNTRPLLLGQCRKVDSGIGPRGRDSVRGQLCVLVGTKVQTSRPRRKARVQAQKRIGTGIGMGASIPQRPTR